MREVESERERDPHIHKTSKLISTLREQERVTEIERKSERQTERERER